jgi:hypothetical protein
MLIVCRIFVIKFRNRKEHNMSKRNVKMSKVFFSKFSKLICNYLYIINGVDVLFQNENK